MRKPTTDEKCCAAFRDGLQAMREMLARFIQERPDLNIADKLRRVWHPAWGPDPGTPEIVESSYRE